MSKSTQPSIQSSHGKPTLESPRRRDLKPLPAKPTTGAAKPRAKNDRPYRAGTRALFQAVRQAEANGSPEAAQLAKRTLQVFRSAQRELAVTGAARGPSVLAHLLTFAQQTVLGQQLGVLAAEQGLDSERGLELLHQSQRAAGRAERAWTATVVAAGLLRGRQPDPGTAQPAPWLDGGEE